MSKLSKRAISTTLVIALFLLSMITVLPMAVAAPLTGESVTAADLRTGIETTYTVAFTTATDIPIDGWMEIVFPVGYTLDAAGVVITTGPTGSFTPVINVALRKVTITTDTLIAATSAVSVEITLVTNPAVVGDYTINIATSVLDTGSAAVTIVQATGTLEITITPDNIGGAVSIDGGPWVYTTPYTPEVAVGSHTVTFKPVLDYITPASQSPVVTLDTPTPVLGTYVPITSGFSIDTVSKTTVNYDDVLAITGSGVTAGTEVKLFWDYASGTYVHLLNTTEGNPDGTFDCDVTVPSDLVGSHFLWATDIATGETVPFGPLTMMPKIELSPSSGLIDDPITIEGYGFSDDSEVTIEGFNLGYPLTTSPTLVETDEDGYFTCKFDVPTDERLNYQVYASDEEGESASATFTVGASISLDPKEGPAGKVVTITGRGWTETYEITLTMGVDPVAVETVGGTTITVGSGDKFSAKIVIPSMTEGTHEITATESVGGKGSAMAEFEVTGESVIKLDPGFGPPGGSVVINGYNFTQISDTVVKLSLHQEEYPNSIEPIGEIETDADGEFSETIRIPAIDYGHWNLIAVDEVYGTSAEKIFKIGVMIIILSPTYGPTGLPVYLTGIGFTEEGKWNATMDGVAITGEAEPVGAGTETISETIFIPTIPVGLYKVTVLDIESEIDLYEMFHVTHTTEAFADPASAPNKYKVIFEGRYFSQYLGADLDFILYNSTHDWDITNEVNVYDPDAVDPYTFTTTVLDADGNFTAWWEVWEKEDLSLGCYKVNVTDENDLFAQIDLCVCEERIYITPRKTKFDRGDTVQFDIKNDFYYDLSYMKIYDPFDNLYWVTKEFAKGEEEWLKVADLYTVPYYAQTSGGNPMTLSPDAPMGEWFWAFYTFEDKQLVNGTFEVGKSAAAILSEQLGKLSGDMSALTDQIDDVTGDIDALSGEIGDVITDVEGMIDDITADLAEELAGVAEDTEAAVGELEDSIGDIATAQNALQSELEDMGQDTAAARQAAEDAQQGTQGLTTIVYGAIACSLIAALAAVVSLMQISKKIA